GPLDRLNLQARRDQLLGQLPAVDAGRELGVLAHPRKRSPHQISIPNGRVNRTSPSTMSYMSSTPCRNISVRSTPTPKAQPLYRSVSTTTATRTRGLTLTQPP